ncbi:hypothetical protein [Salinactinospora qingdaonensis]|uniref:Uncharacterized protein n=1 Tax=Salinactinospora qingdaonensis TaxID=702744 RepID=A0ABP7GAH5_9ACTN
MPAASHDRAYAVPISAGTESALAAFADRLGREIAVLPPPTLSALARSLRGGRPAGPVRRVLGARDLAELREGLHGVATAAEVRTEFEPPEDARTAVLDAAEARVVRDWLAHEPADWDTLRDGEPPRRADLPGTPFTRRSYWFDRDFPDAVESWSDALPTLNG